jgi:Flp pilus assembly pilin Flp
MLFRLRRRKLATDKSGAAAVEFAFIAIALVLFTLGIIDVGFGLYWFNRAEKATQLGVRIASVSDPVSAFLPDFEQAGGGGGGTVAAGASCETSAGTIASYCVHNPIICSVSVGTGSCVGETGAFSNDAFSKIFNEMRVLYPQLSSENVQVEYRPSIAGFVGRPGNAPGTFNLVPQVTVRIVNLRYNYIALGSLIGLASFTLPIISASMTGEDLDHTTNL